MENTENESRACHYSMNVRLGMNVASEFRKFREMFRLVPGVTTPKLEKLKEALCESRDIMELHQQILDDKKFLELIYNYLVDVEHESTYLELNDLVGKNMPESKDNSQAFINFLYRYFLYIVLRNAELWLLLPDRFWSGYLESEILNDQAPINRSIQETTDFESLWNNWRIDSIENSANGSGDNTGLPKIDFSKSLLFVATSAGRLTKFGTKTDERKNFISLRQVLRFIDGDLTFRPVDQVSQHGFTYVVVQLPKSHLRSIEGHSLRSSNGLEYLEDRIWCFLLQSGKSRNLTRDNRRDDICRAAAIFQGRGASDNARREYRCKKKSELDSRASLLKKQDERGQSLRKQENRTLCELAAGQLIHDDDSLTSRFDRMQKLGAESPGLQGSKAIVAPLSRVQEVSMDSLRIKYWKEIRVEFFATIKLRVDNSMFQIGERDVMDLYFEFVGSDESEDLLWNALIEKLRIPEEYQHGLHKQFMEVFIPLNRRVQIAFASRISGERDV